MLSLICMNAWICCNGLCLNAGNSEAILLGTRQHLRTFPSVSSVNIASSPVTVSDRITFTTLGVIIDKHFTSDSHVSGICKKSLFSIFEP